MTLTIVLILAVFYVGIKRIFFSTSEEQITETVSKEEEKSIIVKTPYFNPNNIQEYKPEKEVKKFIYRPETLDEYIGQSKAKSLIRLNIKKINELRSVHFLISGKKGCGKTTLAHIIKNELNATVIERVASEITNPEQLEQLINQINSSNGNVVLFIDELHNLNPKLCEVFYPIMEDFKVAGKNVKPFTLIGATTEKNILVKKVAPLVDRFQVQVELESYQEKDIVEIIKQYKIQLYNEKEMKEENYEKIAKNCKFTPRIAITLLESNLIERNIKRVFNYHDIVKDGLTGVDIKILKSLFENSSPVGEEALAMRADVNRADYKTIYEPYLVEKGYILRTNRGRLLSEKGKQLLGTLLQGVNL